MRALCTIEPASFPALIAISSTGDVNFGRAPRTTGDEAAMEHILACFILDQERSSSPLDLAYCYLSGILSPKANIVVLYPKKQKITTVYYRKVPKSFVSAETLHNFPPRVIPLGGGGGEAREQKHVEICQSKD